MIKLKPILAELTKAEARRYYTYHMDLDSDGPNYHPSDYLTQIAAQLGETVSGGMLGAGSYGVAYPLASGRVLKLTTDKTEIATAAHFRTRRKTRHIMSYYDVRPILPRAEYHQWFAIVMDRVTPLTATQQDWWQNSTYFDAEYTDAECRAALLDSAWIDPKTPEFYRFVDTIIGQRQAVTRAVRSFGVNWHEAHDENVGFDRNGYFTIFDMWSKRADTTASALASFRKMLKPIDLTSYLDQAQPDASGIDTPNDPNM
jgi:hypothetical protein